MLFNWKAAQNETNADDIVPIGSVNRPAVFPRELVKKALNPKAAALSFFPTTLHPALSPS